jgi:cytochrome c peroxidase
MLIATLTLFFSLSADAQLTTKPVPKTAPAPKDNPTTPQKVELGKQLYHDPRLSHDGSVSCATCHNVMAGGEDGMTTSTGIKAQKGGRNSPTVWNSAFMSVQFWDGRANTLEDQAKGPLTNPIEMGMPDHDIVVSRIKKIPGYVTQFEKVFSKEGVTIDTVAKAIAAYERTLVTPNSPYDQYLRGKKSALNASAKRGLVRVQELGCLACHGGDHFAGPSLPIGTGFYQKVPAIPGSIYDKKYDLLSDKGRAAATGKTEDEHLFRVPTWRNVAITAPYFHNGKVKTLSEAVRVMGKIQLNQDLSDKDVTDIVSFLESLTGERPKQTMPLLPSTPGYSLLEE